MKVDGSKNGQSKQTCDFIFFQTDNPIFHGLLLLMTNSKTCEVPKHGLIANPLRQIQGFDDAGVSITYKMQLHPNSRCLPLAQITDLWWDPVAFDTQNYDDSIAATCCIPDFMCVDPNFEEYSIYKWSFINTKRWTDSLLHLISLVDHL